MTEEPGAGKLHAGICAGGGRVTDRPYGDVPSNLCDIRRKTFVELLMTVLIIMGRVTGNNIGLL